MNETSPGLLSSLLVLIGLLGASLWILPRLSGWNRLAARYRHEDDVSGRRFGWISLGFGPLMWYNHCLTVVASPQGLALRMQPVMRLSHPSLLIPWERIAAATPWGGFLVRGVALTLADDRTRLIFRQREYAHMQGAFPERLRLA